MNRCVLMLAPEPFLESRGTPLSVYHRCETLAAQDHRIDLITYHVGESVDLDGVRIKRIPTVPFVDEVPVGPSRVKFVLDLVFFAYASWILLTSGNRYDVLHAHEEAVAIGLVLAPLFRLPLLYDMHSSMPQQLDNFDFSKSAILHHALSWVERRAVRRAAVIIVICKHLEETVREIDPKATVHLIENSLMAEQESETVSSEELEAEFDLGDVDVVLYTGTFEPYQGIDMVVESVAHVAEACDDFVVLLVGGRPDQVGEMEQLAADAGVDDWIVFTGQRPLEEMAAFTSLADLLLSPRVSGTNTPLKIYSYLKAGKPIVATRMTAHTQVLSSETAVLTELSAEEFGKGIAKLLKDPELRCELSEASLALANEKYTRQRFEEKHEAAYANLP